MPAFWMAMPSDEYEWLPISISLLAIACTSAGVPTTRTTSS